MTQDDWLADPQYRDAVADLLGVLAYGELTAFTRLAGDTELSPTQPLKAAGRRAGRRRVPALRDPRRAAARDGHRPRGRDGAVHRARSTPSTSAPGRAAGSRAWSRPTSATASPPTSTARSPPTSTPRPRPWCTPRWRTSARPSSSSRWSARPSRQDPQIAGRLALWGRRLVGEALSQAQQVAVERDALASLLVGGVGGSGPAERRPGRAGPDVRPAHRRAHPPDGPPRPRRLSTSARTVRRAPTAERPRPGGRGPSRVAWWCGWGQRPACAR